MYFVGNTISVVDVVRSGISRNAFVAVRMVPELEVAVLNR